MTGERDAIALAEKVLAVLELGSFSATYKYALFSAILELCLERFSDKGLPPESLSTRQLADKVIEQYWPHAVPYEGRRVLRQGGVKADNQAELLRAIVEFREQHAADPGEPVFRARLHAAKPFERLVRFVEWKLIEMPIPRLQVLGPDEDRFLYDYRWDKGIKRSAVAAYQRGEASTFDNLLRLKPGVAEGLVRLTGILRPLVQREWAAMVAQMNALPEAKLEEFLFGATRVPLTIVRGPLGELQGGRCFYCDERLGGAERGGAQGSGAEPGEVDHFIPWARYPNNALDNLVLAHAKCNNQKRDFLAAAEHVERWAARLEARAGDLDLIARQARWARDPARSRSVALALYTRMPSDSRLWLRRDQLVPIEHGRIRGALAG